MLLAFEEIRSGSDIIVDDDIPIFGVLTNPAFIQLNATGSLC